MRVLKCPRCGRYPKIYECASGKFGEGCVCVRHIAASFHISTEAGIPSDFFSLAMVMITIFSEIGIWRLKDVSRTKRNRGTTDAIRRGQMTRGVNREVLL